MIVTLNKARLSVKTVFFICVTYSAHAIAEDPFDFDLTESAAKDPWQISGYLESRNQYFTVQDDWKSNRLAGFMEVKWEGESYDTHQWRAYGSVFTEHDAQTREYRDPERTELKEFYFLRDGTHFDLTIGKQRVAWGTVDGVSTIDRINAIDYRDPIGNARTASRRPSWVVRNELKLASGILDMVWLPRGRDRKLPEFGSPWEPDYLHNLREQQRAGLLNYDIEDPHKNEGGIRYAVYGEGIDWSVAYFNGYTDQPVKQTGTLTDIRLKPIRIETFNASGAISYAQSTFRAEIAYTPDNIVEGNESDVWQVVVGWDRTFFTNFLTSIQLYHDEIPDGENRYGTTFSFSNKAFNDAATYGLRGQIGNDDQLIAEVYYEYDFGDNLSLNTKYMVFNGAKESVFYDYRQNDFIETTLRWEF